MQLIPIAQLPRQEFSILLDGNRWVIRIVQAGDCMALDFTVNDEVLITGVRAVAARRLLPYDYLQDVTASNFAFTSANVNSRIPWWEDFGVTCSLIYATAEEIANV